MSRPANVNQIDWFYAEAGVTGGDVWTDGPLRWIQPVPGGDLMLLFPEALPRDGARRGMAEADAGARVSDDRRDAARIAIAELQPSRTRLRGWRRPHWMTAAGRKDVFLHPPIRALR